jgi:tetratricopeptide (TPR) repeat protein
MAEQSRQSLRRAHEASRLAYSEDAPETLRLAADLARVLAKSSDGSEAEALARATYDRARRVLGPSDHVTLAAGTALIDSLSTLTRYAECERLVRELVRVTPTPPDEHAHYRLWCLAQALESHGENSEAIRRMYQAMETARATGRDDAGFRLVVTPRLGKLLAAEGRGEDAERVFAAVVSDPVMLSGQFTVGATPQLGDTVEKGYSCAVRSYAALLESHGKATEGARVRSEHLARLRAAVPPPGADSVSALARRANLLARLGKFEEAAANHGRAVALNPGDHWQWYLRGCLLAHADQPDAYRTHCQAMLQQFGTTKDRFVADRTAKTCLLLPGATPDLTRQLRLVNVTLAPGYDQGMLPWIRLLEGMAEYRQGHWAAAIQPLEQSRQIFYEGFDAVKTTATLFLAMAHYQTGHVEPARALLAEARDVMEEKLPKPGVEDLEFIGIEDWLICHVVRREAEVLFAGG